jgi:hypothetical protein
MDDTKKTDAQIERERLDVLRQTLRVEMEERYLQQHANSALIDVQVKHMAKSAYFRLTEKGEACVTETMPLVGGATFKVTFELVEASKKARPMTREEVIDKLVADGKVTEAEAALLRDFDPKAGK